jgi:tRNA 2-thiouridine synthesizing protein E
MEATYGGHAVEVNPEGYLTKLEQWNREVAQAIANEEQIELSDEHWPVLEFLQNQYKNDVPLSIRKVGKSGIIDIKGFYALFPGGPLKKASRIAGIPKPASCI